MELPFVLKLQKNDFLRSECSCCVSGTELTRSVLSTLFVVYI